MCVCVCAGGALEACIHRTGVIATAANADLIDPSLKRAATTSTIPPSAIFQCVRKEDVWFTEGCLHTFAKPGAARSCSAATMIDDGRPPVFASTEAIGIASGTKELLNIGLSLSYSPI